MSGPGAIGAELQEPLEEKGDAATGGAAAGDVAATFLESGSADIDSLADAEAEASPVQVTCQRDEHDTATSSAGWFTLADARIDDASMASQLPIPRSPRSPV